MDRFIASSRYYDLPISVGWRSTCRQPRRKFPSQSLKMDLTSFQVTHRLPKEFANTDGELLQWQEGEAYDAPARYALCRCGHSHKAPFCDGSHAKIGFDGSETSERTRYSAQATVFDGRVLALLDAKHLCADGRFCDPNGKVWTQVAHTDDPEIRSTFLRQVHRCPAGRLVAFDKAAGTTIEEHLPVSIGLIEDPVEHCSGPIWLRGGIERTVINTKSATV